jgi:hypothetical protein
MYLKIKTPNIIVVSKSIDVPSDDGLYGPKHVRVLRSEVVKASMVTRTELFYHVMIANFINTNRKTETAKLYIQFIEPVKEQS